MAVTDFQTQMNQLVRDFVAEITELARAATRDMIDRALSVDRERSIRPLPLTRVGRRDASAIDDLASQFVAFVRKHPGLRIEQINKQLGTTTKQLGLPIRKAIADGLVKTKGKRRSTTYFGA